MASQFLAELIEEALTVANDYGYATGYAAGVKAAERDVVTLGPDPEKIEKLLGCVAEKLYNGVEIGTQSRIVIDRMWSEMGKRVASTKKAGPK